MANENVEYRQGSSNMERHAQSVMTLIAVALLIWVGANTQDAAVKIATLEVQVRNLQERIDRPSQTVQLLINQNEELRSRVLAIEEELRTHEVAQHD